MKPLLLMLLTTSCILAAAHPNSPSDESKWKDRLVEIAGEYVKYGRVDAKYRWSPEDCMMPGGPPRMHFSQARDKEAHGQKLYTIFAKEVNWDLARIPTYLPPRMISASSDLKTMRREPAPIGQVIVKEAWIPKAISREEFAREAHKQLPNQTTKSIKDSKGKGGILDFGDQVRPYAVARDGAHWFQAEKKAGLFIMMKLDPFKANARIINISSDAGVEAYAGWGGYGSSKAALEQLSAILAAENPALHVYRVDPGDMRTQMHQEAFPTEDISDRALPEESVPALIALLTGDFPSGRYKIQSRTAPELV